MKLITFLIIFILIILPVFADEGDEISRAYDGSVRLKVINTSTGSSATAGFEAMNDASALFRAYLTGSNHANPSTVYFTNSAGGFIFKVPTGFLFTFEINNNEILKILSTGITVAGTIGATNLSGTNTGDQVSSDFEIADLTDSFNLRGSWNAKLDSADIDTYAELNTIVVDKTLVYSGGAFHDGFSDFVANEHIDWTVDQGATEINKLNLGANLGTLYTPSTWKLFYSNGSSAITELALGASGTYLKSAGAAAPPIWDTPAGGGSSTFLGLTDTPAAYTGQAGKVAAVNSGGTGLEFIAQSGGASGDSTKISLNNTEVVIIDIGGGAEVIAATVDGVTNTRWIAAKIEMLKETVFSENISAAAGTEDIGSSGTPFDSLFVGDIVTNEITFGTSGWSIQQYQTDALFFEDIDGNWFKIDVSDAAFYASDDIYSFGTTDNRWSTIYSINGDFNDDLDVGGTTSTDGLTSDGSETTTIFLQTTLTTGQYTSSEVYQATAGESLAFGDVIYLKSTDSEVYICDADDPDTFPALGFVVSTATNGTTVNYIKSGRACLTAWSFSNGDKIYIKAGSSSGDCLTATAPTTTDYIIQKIGQQIAMDIIEISIPYPYYQVT